MDHLIAKVKTRTGNKYRKLLSDVAIFSVTIDDSVEYSPATLLEDDQWYRLSHFSNREFCIDILREPWDSTEYELLNTIDVAKMDYLCSYQSENEYHFQRVYKSNLLRGKRFMHIGDNIQVEERENILILSDTPDAVYYKDADCLYFKKLETIATIFKGIDILYREATQPEVESFLNNGFIALGDDYSAPKVGKANRRRVAMAIDTLSKLDDQQKQDVFTYTNQYHPGLHYDGRAFAINSENDLKNLLYGIEQRFYTTPVTNEKRVANSITLIEQPPV